MCRFIHLDDPIAQYFEQLTDDDRHAFMRHLRDLAISMHGNANAVSHIGDAVRKYFDFGQMQGKNPESSA
jgi:hypothetical protein